MYLFCPMSAWSHDIGIENRQGSIFLSWNQLALGRLVRLKDEIHGFRFIINDLLLSSNGILWIYILKFREVVFDMVSFPDYVFHSNPVTF